MKPSSFDYHVPETAEEAVALLADLGDGAKVLAGGQRLIPMLSLRITAFDHLVDIGRIAGLRSIEQDDGSVAVGAATIDAAVEHDALVGTAAPLIHRATPLIGHFQIRNRGTLGGSIAHADPASEYCAVALTLDAEIDALSPRGQRRIPAREFFRGYWSTALEADELLVGVRFPMWSGRCGFSIREFARRHGDFAVAGAVVAVELDPDDCVVRCAIGLFGLGTTPLRATAAEQAATGQPASAIGDTIGRMAVDDLSGVPADVHGSASYRKRVGAAMVTRAWRDAVEEAARG